MIAKKQRIAKVDALDMLRVECTRCQRKGHYHVHKLIERYGRKGDVMKWRELLTQLEQLRGDFSNFARSVASQIKGLRGSRG